MEQPPDEANTYVTALDEDNIESGGGEYIKGQRGSMSSFVSKIPRIQRSP